MDLAHHGGGDGAAARIRVGVLDQRPAERQAAPPLAPLAQDVREAGRADARACPRSRCWRSSRSRSRTPRSPCRAPRRSRARSPVPGRPSPRSPAGRRRVLPTAPREPTPAPSASRPACRARRPGASGRASGGRAAPPPGARRARLDGGQGGAEAPADVQHLGSREARARRVLGPPAGANASAAADPRRERPLGAAAQGEHAADGVVRRRDVLQLAATRSPVDHLAPGTGRPGQIAGELGAGREAFQELESHGLRSAAELERALVEACGVAVGVDALGGLCGLGQRCARAGVLAGAEPVRGALGCGRACLLEGARDRRVQRAPTRPGDRLVDGVAHERMPELEVARAARDEEPGRERLGDRVARSRRRRPLGVAALPDDGGPLEHAACGGARARRCGAARRRAASRAGRRRPRRAAGRRHVSAVASCST